MKYYINQKFFTIVREQFNIIDENQVPQFAVQGQALWAGKRLSIFDMQNNLLFTLNRRLFRFFITVDVLNAQKEKLARFREKFHIGFRNKYTMLTENGVEYAIDGNFFGTDYTINRLQTTVSTDDRGREIQTVVEQPVAQISKGFLQFSDKYQVEVFDQSETMMVLATVLCVDMARVVKSNRNNQN